jgi:hypothetical protein
MVHAAKVAVERTSWMTIGPMSVHAPPEKKPKRNACARSSQNAGENTPSMRIALPATTMEV